MILCNSNVLISNSLLGPVLLVKVIRAGVVDFFRVNLCYAGFKALNEHRVKLCFLRLDSHEGIFIPSLLIWFVKINLPNSQIQREDPKFLKRRFCTHTIALPSREMLKFYRIEVINIWIKMGKYIQNNSL